MKVITALRRLALMRVAATLVIITTGLGSYLLWSSSPAKAATSDDILFVHGFAHYSDTYSGDSRAGPGGCVGAWGSAAPYFSQLGWTGNLKTVGYYRGDWRDNGNHCDIQFDSQAPSTSHVSACDGYFYDPNTEGTNNQDLRNLSCQLAWYIFQHYTSQNKNVWIVAHSMGGLITRNALFQVEVHNPAFPLYLYVPGVVTFATPHGGILDPGAAGFLCGGCTQASNMQPNAGPPSSFINTLLTETYAPMGSPGEPTEWTAMGSTGESWTNGGVPPSTSLDLPASRPGYPAVHKVEYTNVPPDPLDNPPLNNPYHHGDYLYDIDGNQDATANLCDNCSGVPSASSTVYHSLRLAFQHLSVSVPAAPTHAVINVPNGGGFFDAWQAMGGVHGPLGDPTSDFYNVGNGQEQDFQGGSIYWSSATGTYEVQGSIHSEYASTMKGPTGALGFPVTNEEGISNGRVSYFAGQVCNGGFVPDTGLVSGSAIFFTSGTGAHEVQGCIYQDYMGKGGPGILGFPLFDEQGISTGRVSYFTGQVCNGGYVVSGKTTGSASFYSSGTGAHEVQGCIYHEYWVMGGPGALGFPVTDEQSIAGGHASYFAGQVCGSGGYTINGKTSGSAIFDTPATSAHEVKGCVYAEYMNVMGGPGGALGFPVTDEQGIAGGHVSYFAGTTCTSGAYQGSRSAIFDTPATSAHEVQGCIYQLYVQLMNGPGGALGFPTSDEHSVTSGYSGVSARSNSFQHGAIYWTSARGALEVQGSIYNAYLSYGGASGAALGLPITNEYSYDSAGDRESDFENGYIRWVKATGQTSVYVYPPCC